MNYKKSVLVLLLLFAQVHSYCQEVTDTAALIMEYNKVMAFTAQPDIYYTTVTRFDANPVLQEQDTSSITGEFFKTGNNIYSNNVREEMYLQDSLMININNDRKTIWINRVDVETKGKMNVLPVGTKEIQEIMQRNYTISKSKPHAGTSRILFETRRPVGSTATSSTNILIEYDNRTYLPQNIVIEINMKEPVDEEMLEVLKDQDVEAKKMMEEINGKKYLVRKQRMNILFTAISNDKERAMQMPSFNACLNYDVITGEFTGKGKYQDYEITKLF